MAIIVKVPRHAAQAGGGATENPWLAQRGQKLGLLVLLWLVLFPLEAWAGPPFLTDDPQTVEVAKPVLLGVEVYHQTASEVGGREDTAFNIGTVIDLSEAHHLLFSAGRSINGPTDFQCYFAYQWTFDNSVFHLGKTSPK